DVFSDTGEFIARGLFNSQSKICVRLYSWQPDVPLNRDFFKQKLEGAIRLRRELLALVGPEQACRLVFSEGDGLSGLTVDRYGEWLNVQITSLAIARRKEMIAELLAELVQPRGIGLRTEKGI